MSEYKINLKLKNPSRNIKQGTKRKIKQNCLNYQSQQLFNSRSNPNKFFNSGNNEKNSIIDLV